MEKVQAPGLRWHGGRPLWRATKAAVRAGYPVKSANLSSLAQNPAALVSRCERLQTEMKLWLSGHGSGQCYDGTISSLIKVYQTDPESSYRALKPSSRHPYDVYARMLMAEVGKRRIDACDGRDLRRWFTAWSTPDREGRPPRLAAARMAMTVLKAALSFGKTCRMRGCAELKSIFDEIEFPAPKPRRFAPTAADVTKARRAAHELGHSPAALAYAIQFEGSLRQWDVIGEWIPLNDPRPSAVIDGRKKWIGPLWSQVDDSLILRITPSKTESSSGASVSVDLRLCAMVVEEMAGIERKGPLIINPATRLPYRQWYFRDLWRRVADRCGIDRAVWNRDLRAGGITEAREAGAPTDDVARTAGHSDKRTTARIYDRDTLEAARRVAVARTAYRTKDTR